MGGVIAPSASVTRTSVPWQILLPVDLHSSRAGRHPLQAADRNVSSFPPPSPWLESIHCCSWSYYRYAPAKCKTSICHLSAHQLSSMKTSHYATPLPVSSTSSTRGYWSYFGPFEASWEEVWSVSKVSPAVSVSVSPPDLWKCKKPQLQPFFDYFYQ